MERELLITGIGGQGVQLSAQVLARAATLEGREVMYLGLYGGMMRGGNTDSTVVIADGPILAPPVVSRVVGDRHARRLLARGRGQAPARWSRARERHDLHQRGPYRRRRAPRPGDDRRHRSRQPALRFDGDARRVLRHHRHRLRRRTDRSHARVDPAVPDPTHRSQRARCGPERGSCPWASSRRGTRPVSEATTASTPEPMVGIKSRGTVTIDVEHCKGCDLCIPACPPGVLAMSTAVNHMGYRYPELYPGCTGLRGVLLRVPRPRLRCTASMSRLYQGPGGTR